MIKRKELGILFCIVIVDLATKIISNYFLPFQENVFIFQDKVSLYLTYNQGVAGGQAEFILNDEYNNVALILSCFNGLILLTYILFIRKKKLKNIYKVFFAILLIVALSILSELLGPHLSEWHISTWTTSIIGKLSGLTLYGSILLLSKDKWIRLSILCILAGGLGNLISHFYMPFRVIDFISIEGTYELLRIGVFNFADLAIIAGQIGLILSILVLLSTKVRRSRSLHR